MLRLNAASDSALVRGSNWLTGSTELISAADVPE
jgi:hypothetical protein